MKEKKQQKTNWKNIGQPDLRHLDMSKRLPDQPLVRTVDSADAAMLILEQHLGFIDAGITQVEIITPMDVVVIERTNLRHIVEKRQDARERYVRHALATIRDPYEIWIVEYEDEHGKALNKHRHGKCIYIRP